MNKQEAIEEIKDEKKRNGKRSGSLDYLNGKRDGLVDALKIIKQIDEQEKPVVPQFVADWYEENKNDFEYNLYRLCIDYYERKLHEDLHEWFGNDKNKPIEVLVLMNKYGYEVEKEKLYTVEIPNPHGFGHCILIKDIYKNIFINYVMNSGWQKNEVSRLTEAEIKKDFEWAWQFAKEV